ncbi:MAG: xanthine dehydrogenase family protein molybdopterin-binding subunit, partial [Rhodospirillaceae bacterium]|nr:xanthine dehydrogenase family protein molybdopterin-binding subunit [Rhodospirillaceae bacterium]
MQFGIGQPNLRTEDPRLVRGMGRYADDVNLVGQLYGVALRSPHAYAEVKDIDSSAARAAPGVRLVLTAADLAADGVGPMPERALLDNRDGTRMLEIPHPVLVGDRVRHVGDPVAFVVAETAAQARDAAELIEVDYEPLDPAIGTAEALEPGAPQIWAQVPGNLILDWEIGNAASTAKALAEAAHIVELKVDNNRVVVAPMEPRAALGDYDSVDNSFTLHVCSQGTHKLAAPLATCLNVTPGSLRVLTGDVGGAFGMKNFLFHEYVLVLAAARRLRCPVKWTADRSESFVSDLQGRDRVMTGRMAFDADHRITGLHVDMISNFGAYVSSFMPFVATLASTAVQSMAYAIPAIHTEVRGVLTNTVPIDAYRGAGRPETGFMVERLLDKAARRFDMSAADLRRRNFIAAEQFPWDTGLGFVYDCGEFERHLDLALTQSDAEGFLARRDEARTRGRLRGLGITGVFDRCGGLGPDMVDMQIDPSGGVTLKVGTQTNGQGHETAYKQIVAGGLGIDPSNIRVLQGDNDLVPYGSGNGGSNFIAVAGSACAITVEKAIEKGRRIAAHLLEAAEADIEFRDGTCRIVGTDRTMSLTDIVAKSYNVSNLPAGEEPGFQVIGSFKPADGPTYPNGTHICELEVDPETGSIELLRYVAVDDVGTVVNPLLVDGQVHGGVAQGIGQALTEDAVYDRDSGQLLTGSFMDYQLPRADDLPDIECDRISVPTPRNPLGVKGNGEAGAIG